MLIKLTKKQRVAYLVLETEDACGADGDDGEVNVGLCVSRLRFPFASPVFLF